MPPSLPIAQISRCCRLQTGAGLQTSSSPLVSLFAALSIQTREASILASLSDTPGAYHKRIRKGRGPSSGKGKTSGRGQKGTKARGNIKPWFQGGQTPLVVKNGIRGFENLRAPEMTVVNLNRIQEWIDNGRLNPKKQITPRELAQSGLVNRKNMGDGIKLLARGKVDLKTPIDIMVSRASASAIAAVEATGGKIMTRFYTKESMRRLVSGQSVHTAKPLPVGEKHVQSVLAKARNRKHVYRLPDPTSRSDIEYYRDPAHRGYLSHMLQPGESPSLYFKVPGERKAFVKSKADLEKAAQAEDDRLF